MSIIRHSIHALLAALAVAAVSSCSKYNYVDPLQDMGSRVEVLEKSMTEHNNELKALSEILHAIEARGYVTNVTENADGTYTITFNNGTTYTLRHGHQGTDGREATLLISVAQDPDDGLWYWTLNGKWLLDGNGHRMQASANDGKDGNNGKSAAENGAVVPQVRINPTTRNWEISNDGGNTWSDTGIPADGKDGQDGKNGEDCIFISITVADDGKSITFTLRDGRTFTVPIVEE